VSGLAFDGRGKLLDETLEIVQTLWRNQVAAHDGPSARFEKIHMMPKPLQPGGVPVWVSGRLNANVARRLARFGSGWIPWGDEAADMANSIPKMRDMVAAAGGDPSGIGVVGSLKIERDSDGAPDLDRTMAVVPAQVEAGVTDFRFVARWGSTYQESLEMLIGLVTAFRVAAGRK
jgi:alkanesulfonate monooxygenase SsuD/methylene tetrahydromethanopterin reductase-like flavin-dependent oxidoreductase (luciferase family)